MIKGNIGEWSEIYAFFKLLEEGKLYVGNALLERTEFFYPIVSILRNEGHNESQYAYEGDVIIVSGTKPEIRIPKKKFAEMSETLLVAMNESTGSFMVKEVEQFMKSMDCSTLKASSKDKSDIKVVIHDSKTGLEHNLGFNIKSRLGAASTLLNASKATNIIYKLNGINPSLQSKANQINLFSEKFKLFEQKNVKIKYHDFANKVFKNNLIMVDSSLPEIVSELALQYFRGKISNVWGIMEGLKKSNPLEFDVSTGHDFYGHKVKRMLTDMALGMVPSKIWSGEYITSGGYLIVKEDGDIICYHIHDRTVFENYLFHNTKLETPSTTRHGYGKVEKVGNDYFINLNLQIRFK
jgi:type II restriction enzyme